MQKNILLEPLLKLLTLFLLWGLLSGCSTLNYYYQALDGQLEIMNKRQDIKRLIDAKDTPPIVAEKLKLVLRLRDFAQQHLQLNVGSQYSRYSDLKRGAVVWNVVAAPEFSIAPKAWCFPIAGCVAYRGYFKQQDAERKAESLRQQGYDVFLGAVAAYSTLGWFEDPILNTFLKRAPRDLASLLFHELAHQQLYVQNDSVFNESFATAVEIMATQQWLKQEHRSEEIIELQAKHQRQAQFVALILDYRQRLQNLYNSDLEITDKRQQKKHLQTDLRQAYQRLKTEWNYQGYDAWFKGSLNNAQLATVSTYHTWVASFKALFHGQAQGDWTKFYALSAEIGALEPEKRTQRLEQLKKEYSNSP